ncbi:non-ribosomal peptide synthetase/type I polyketide synthase [Chitinophaga rhizophila]|uniref:Amino acid adenylation domain-containing protein n=1 Tax=Chitinophaga rhizophila TaxID=2866212 RepID=A0ABS7GHQ1_9BACT|nr:non-ribosomal peptide synthetase/type I polyketide synthase [Chitinophaga rhizophila]MBW8687217.1 amino acid adenylation domain-containing protein [Chitinophaga rhizophila]
MEKYTGLEIAVVGLSGRFPGSANISEYWENLKGGKNCITTFTDEELSAAGISSMLLENPHYVKANAFLADKQYFDAAFFNYTPDEAELMDPQIRLFHECCWNALEDSGYVSDDPSVKIGLFGSGTPNVNWELYARLKNRSAQVDDFAASHLRMVSFLCTTVAYKLNLRGPAVFVQTACSSSLVAIVQACNSLLLGECTMALAGGVSIANDSIRGYLYKEGLIYSRDGKNRAFDSAASGTVGGEGVGVVALKRLKDALNAGDHIHAVIRGAATNNDGSAKAGFTTPGVKGQADVIRRAIKMSGVHPDTISYVETHGTATNLGDPAEIAALNEAFVSLGGTLQKHCAIGTVKSNIGHLDSAAGVAGFIKTVLSLKHKQLPASLHFESANPKIPFDLGPFYVNAYLSDLKKDGKPLRAGVSSFGIGGTNAHVVLEEAPTSVAGTGSREHQLLLFSAKTPSALRNNIDTFRQFLNRQEDINIADVAYTLQKGRSRFRYRQALTVNSREGALISLEAGHGENYESLGTQEDYQEIIFMFSGQGAQYANMCRDLYQKEPAFKGKVDECLQIAAQFTNVDLHSILFPNDINGNDIKETEYAQPLLFIISYALAQQLIHWGIRPASMIGHSIGEYVAAALSGVLSLTDAIRIVIRRGQLMSEAEKGAMLSLSMSEQQVRELLQYHNDLEIAVINSASSVVVSGTENAIREFEADLTKAGRQAKRLHTSHAFHSKLMEGVLAEFEKEFKNVTFGTPSIPYISNVTGQPVTFEQISRPGYWSQHLRSTVQFSAGIDYLLEKGPAVLVEVGPGRSLCNYVQESLSMQPVHRVVNTVRQIKQVRNDQEYLISKVGQLWGLGVSIQWDNFYSTEKRKRVSVPGYVFDKTAYTADVDAEKLIVEQLAGQIPSSEVHINAAYWESSLAPNAATPIINDTCLIIAGYENFSLALKAALHKAGTNIVMVQPGKDCVRFSDHSWEVDFDSAAAWDDLFQQLALEFAPIGKIFYCASLDDHTEDADFEAISPLLSKGYVGLGLLAGAIARARFTHSVQIVVAGNHLAGVMDADQVNPLKCAIHAPAKIIPVEQQNIRCRVIDIPYPFSTDVALQQHVSLLINELHHYADDVFVAYRYGQRWTPSFKTFVPNESYASGVQIVAGNTYLVTGGTGGMGFSVARDIVMEHDANVVIVHRSSIENRTEVLQSMEEMRATGHQVTLFQADIADEEQVQLFFDFLQSKGIAVNGLIWAAGEVDFGGIMMNRDGKGLMQYVRSKIHGLLLFEKYLNFSQLDFLALFSSVGNVLYQSKFGQVAYNAANEFLQAYARYIHRKSSVHAFTINWCDWLDVGMTFKTRVRETGIHDTIAVNALIADAIYPSEGIRVFHQCLGQRLPVATISKGSLKYQIRRHQHATLTNVVGETPAPILAIQNTSDYQNAILQIFGSFFGKSDIRPQDNFFELGGDSLKGMILLARLNKELGLNFTIGDLYQYPTVQQLADSRQNYETNNVLRHIPVAPPQRDYVLSSAQKRLFFLQILEDNREVYNETQVFWMHGRLDKKKIEQTFIRLIQRHESLRTAFIFDNDMPRQIVMDDFDFSVTALESTDGDLQSMIRAFVQPFDLSIAPLIRVGIMTHSEEQHLVIIDSHHIVADGVSQGVMVSDFMKLYNDHVLPPLKLHYKDYSEWQQGELMQSVLQEQRVFWMKEFADEIPVLELPVDFPRPMTRSHVGGFLDFELSPVVTGQLKQIADRENVSMFMLLLAVYNVLLSKLSGSEDIIIGTSTAGRPHADLEQMVGMFVNSLVLRNKPASGLSFREFLQHVKVHTLLCFANQDYQYETLIEDLKIDRDTSRNPLFDVDFVYQNFEGRKLELEGMILESYHHGVGMSKFDLTLSAFEVDDKLALNFAYAAELFRDSTIQRFANYFNEVIEDIVSNQDILLADINILPEEERNQILYQFNDTDRSYPTETFIDLFKENVLRFPAKTAVIHHSEILTYEELDTLSDRLAGFIQSKELAGGTVIPLLMDRGIQLLAWMLAVQKSGHVFVSLDTRQPGERIARILEACNPGIIITTQHHTNLLHTVIPVILAEEVDANVEYPLRPSEVTPDMIAYLAFTSGSTGMPKGVLLHHGGMMNHFYGLNEILSMTADDCMAQTAECSFDVYVVQMLLALTVGGSTHIIDRDVMLDPERLSAVVTTGNITVLEVVPSVIRSMLGSLPLGRLRWMISTGEALNRELAVAWYKHYPAIRLLNAYGPAETSDDATYYIIPADLPETGIAALPIGTPLPNFHVYVLDAHRHLCPVGVKGEICIAGPGVGKGYQGDAALTALKFVPNPVITRPGYNTLYLTGDVGYLDHDGNIVLAGRRDTMVKVRGARIETGEIEQALLQWEGIKDAVVVSKDHQGNQYLVAYYAAETQFDKLLLQQHLAARLPDYMIPAICVHMQRFPVTLNGKVDKRALPEPVLDIDPHTEGPIDEIEETLIEMWAELLKLDKSVISINHGFFELGGNSIHIIALNKRVNKAFSCKISVANMFRLPTIASMADFIRKGDYQLSHQAARVDEAFLEATANLSLFNEILNKP